jgi:hypothetical protein
MSVRSACSGIQYLPGQRRQASAGTLRAVFNTQITEPSIYLLAKRIDLETL